MTRTRWESRSGSESRLIDIEVRSIQGGVRRNLSNLTLGMAIAEQIISFLRQRKDGRRSS